MAYDQQIQKQETEKSNIVNPKTELSNGRLELLRKPDLLLLKSNNHHGLTSLVPQ